MGSSENKIKIQCTLPGFQRGGRIGYAARMRLKLHVLYARHSFHRVAATQKKLSSHLGIKLPHYDKPFAVLMHD